MDKKTKLALVQNRYNKLSENPKNIKCPGTLRKLARQIRNLSSEVTE